MSRWISPPGETVAERIERHSESIAAGLARLREAASSQDTVDALAALDEKVWSLVDEFAQEAP